jgi:hypothetical protein
MIRIRNFGTVFSCACHEAVPKTGRQSLFVLEIYGLFYIFPQCILTLKPIISIMITLKKTPPSTKRPTLLMVLSLLAMFWLPQNASAQLVLGRNSGLQEKGGSSVPAWVTNAFNSKYPERLVKKWSYEDNTYLVDFAIDDFSCTAYFKDGKWAKTAMLLSYAKLPQKLKDAFVRYGIQEKFLKKVELLRFNDSPQSVYYVEFVDKENTTWFYHLSKDGEVLSFTPK